MPKTQNFMVPKSNATQQFEAGVKIFRDQAKSGKLSRYSQRQIAKGMKHIAKNSQNTAVGMAKSFGQTASQIVGQVVAGRAAEAGTNAYVAKGAKSDATESLKKWNAAINMDNENPYVAGDEGNVSGDSTTGSLLGG